MNHSRTLIQRINGRRKCFFNLINEIAEVRLPSSSSSIPLSNTSLDPVDWSSTRYVTHNLLDSMLNYIQSIRDRPVWQPIPPNIRMKLENEVLPELEQSLSDVCQDTLTSILPYSLGNTHPRFWAWVVGEGTLGGVMADMVAATTNAMTGAGTHTAVILERTVIKWMRQVFGFPEGNTGGLIASGTTMATVTSLAAARQKVLSNVRKDGLVNGPQLVAYGSTEVHFCVVRALELLGIGSNALRRISVDENFSINIKELKTRIQVDRDDGFVPFCIIGNAGTISTGAFDNLVDLSAVAKCEKIWLHVDGAFGSLVILDPQRRHLVAGIDQADSLAFDFHKWLHCPYESGCVLVRDPSLLLSTFSANRPYLLKFERGISGDAPWPNSLGPEMSRSFRALKIWFTLKEHGLRKLGQKIADNCEQAQYLASLLEQHVGLIRVVRPVTINVVNFRFEPPELANANAEIIDHFNNELMADIQEAGVAAPSTTHFGERLYIRVAIVSHRCTLEDFDLFVETLLKLCHARLQGITQNNTSK